MLRHAIAGVVAVYTILFASITFGEIRRVPQDYGSIQAAFDAVADNDTVLVSLGTYAEELSAPPHRFWFIGDVPIDTGDFPRPIIDPSSLDSAQWRKCMTIPDNAEVAIERMAFRNRAPMFPRWHMYGWSGIVVMSELPITLRYCAFDSTWGGIMCSELDGPPAQIFVEDCQFTHGQRSQVASSGRVDVRRSVFLQGRHMAFVFGKDDSRVEDCLFMGDSTFSTVWLRGQHPVVRNNLFGPIDTSIAQVLRIDQAHDAIVEGNVFHDIRVMSSEYFCTFIVDSGNPIVVRYNQFLNIRASHSSLAFAHSPMESTGVLAAIDSNLFLNMIEDCTWAADKALGFGSYSLVRGNRFINLSPVSVACVYPSHPYNAPPPEFRYNIFQAGDYAIYTPYRSADAIWNYWGDPSGPYNANFNPNGLGARVDDPVWFDPWSPDTNFLSVPDSPSILHPLSFILSAYPNPFNSTVHLTLIPSDVQIVKVELFDLLGRKVQEIWHGPLAFQKDITFDASALASGIYFACVTSTIFNRPLATTKLVLLK